MIKIEESDGVLVINPDNYIGESTSREILWARLRDKPVYFTDVDEHPRDLSAKYLLTYGSPFFVPSGDDDDDSPVEYS